jgi:hypothetical protein
MIEKFWLKNLKKIHLSADRRIILKYTSEIGYEELVFLVALRHRYVPDAMRSL